MSADFILQYMKTEIQLLGQKIERMVMKKIDDMDAKMSNMIETKNKESQSIVQRESTKFYDKKWFLLRPICLVKSMKKSVI